MVFKKKKKRKKKKHIKKKLPKPQKFTAKSGFASTDNPNRLVKGT